MKLERLLNDEPWAAYWNGFIAADGDVSDRRLRVRLAAKDAAHVQRLSEFIELGRPLVYERNGITVGLSAQNPSVVQELRQRFDYRDRKTYNPPRRLPYEDPALLLSWMAGFIDGDGTIKIQTGRRSVYLTTVSHPSWTEFLDDLSTATGFGRVTLRSDGYAQLGSYRHKEIVELKRTFEQLGLPLLRRKWDRVDENLHVVGGLKPKILELIGLGKSNRDILDETGCSPAYISKLRKS